LTISTPIETPLMLRSPFQKENAGVPGARSSGTRRKMRPSSSTM